ncbi:monocarboxylate transporter 12-like isoform X2 [Ptychodera flava]|uniref:monocarboxylate transporter 12-like isoform X2 n=1 Tax=Ptychodera flava TaxID=63121 RepID=UPI00396A00B9
MKGATPGDPPDGGWGWMVVMAAFFGFLIGAGSRLSFGVLFVAFLDAFGESNVATAWIHGIFSIVYALSTSYGVALSKRFGHRKTVMAAGVLASSGIFASAFATKLHHLYITYGILTAIGLGLTYALYIVMVSAYFSRRFTIAIGLAMAGTGAGLFVFSVTTQLLVDHYGWRGSLIILSGIASHVCVVGALLRPVKGGHAYEPQREVQEEALRVGIQYDYSDANTSELNTVNVEVDASRDPTVGASDAVNSRCNRKCARHLKSCLSAAYDFSLFKNPTFLVLSIIIIGQTIGIKGSETCT